MTFAGGLATEGFKPFAAIYSTFLQRGYDQVVHDIAIQRLPVRFAIDRAGLVGADGPTHAGAFDVTYLGCLPGFVLMAAADEAELAHMVATAVAIDDRPSALRYPRGEGLGVPMPAEGQPLEIGKGRIIQEGHKVALLSYGARLGECLKAAKELTALGLSTTIADARFAKPLDIALLTRLAREHEVLITIEEGAIGGFSTYVLQALAEQGLLDQGLRVRCMVLPTSSSIRTRPRRCTRRPASTLAQSSPRSSKPWVRTRPPKRSNSPDDPYSLLLRGTFLPFLRASERPMAIACFRLLTFLPLRPLLSVPFFRFRITRSTSFDAPFEYLRAILLLLKMDGHNGRCNFHWQCL